MSAAHIDILGPNLGINGVAATATQNGADLANPDGRGVKVVINTTAAGTSSNTYSIQGKIGGTYVTLLASAAVSSNVVTTLTVYPGITATTNVSASDVLPRVWRVVCAAGNANPANFSIAACVLA
jgi:hypothetical protein